MPNTFSEKIIRIEKITLHGKRPRNVGMNARKGIHGDTVTDPVVRIHVEGGTVGVGWSKIKMEEAKQFLGKQISDLFQLPNGSMETASLIDLPLWDLVAKLSNLPLYQLLGARGSREVELYDGSIYIDDLEASDAEASEIFCEEIQTGRQSGYQNFKIKIGRGARWMPIMEGLARDVLVIQTIRKTAGPEAKILVDANMGNTLNTTKEIITRCAEFDIYWFEEPFAEDPSLNQDLKEFIHKNGYDIRIADGEFSPPSYFFELVRKGWIDIVQHDFRAFGLTWWKRTAEHIEPWGAQCAPHCWGSHIDRYAHAHFAASIPHYSLLEAAPIDMPGTVLDGWKFYNGKIIVPDSPGIGFDLDPDVIEKGVKRDDGFTVSIK